MISLNSSLTWVANSIVTYANAGAIGVFFLGANYADHRGIGDLFASIAANVVVIYYKEGIHAFNALAFSVYSFPYSLAEVSHIVGEVLVPYFGVFRVVVQLVVLQELACVFIRDRHGPERY